MKRKHNIESKLKEGAASQKVAVDTDRMWDRVEPHLETKRRKRILPFWMSGLLLGIVGLSGFFILRDGGFFKDDDIQTTKTENSVETDKTKKGYDAKTYHKITESVLSDIRNSKQDEIDNRSKKALVVEGVNSRNESKTSRNESKTGELPFAQSYDQVTTTSNHGKGNDRGYNLNSVESITDKNESYKHFELASIQNKQVEVKQVKSDAVLFNDLPNIQQPVYFASFINMTSLGGVVLHHMIPSPPPYRHRMMWEPEFNKWRMSLSGGYSNTITSLRIKDIEFRNHLLNRLTAESPLSSWHLRLLASYRINPKWSLRGGFIYTQLYRRSQSTLVYSEQVTLDNVIIERVIGPNGIEEKFGKVEVIQKTQKDVVRVNRISDLDAQVMLMRHFEMYDFELGIGFGGTYNFDLDQRGYIHPFKDREYNLSVDKNNWYKPTKGVSLQLEFNVTYPITDLIGIQSYATYSSPLRSISSIEYGIKEKISAYHIGFGLQFKL